MSRLNTKNQRLVNEIGALQRCQKRFGLPAKPVIDQLVTDSEYKLPDTLPVRPEWIKFEWPWSGEVDWRSYWQSYDHERRIRG